MSAGEIAAAVREMLVMTILLVSPFLGAALVTGFVLGLLQAGTRINDLTFTFVPRLLAVLATVYLAAAWTVGQMTALIERSFAAVRALGG
jgi:flagellar biosynthesis protein FliQ